MMLYSPFEVADMHQKPEGQVQIFLDLLFLSISAFPIPLQCSDCHHKGVCAVLPCLVLSTQTCTLLLLSQVLRWLCNPLSVPVRLSPIGK